MLPIRHLLLSAALLSALSLASAAQAARPAAKSKGVVRVSTQNMKVYTDALKNAQNRNAATQQQVQKLRGDLNKIITAPTFDKQAYVAKSNEIETLNTQMHKNVAEATAAALAQFTSEERNVMARSVKKSAGKAKKKRGASKGTARAKKTMAKTPKSASKSASKAAAAKTPKTPKTADKRK